MERADRICVDMVGEVSKNPGNKLNKDRNLPGLRLFALPLNVVQL